jgi:hypothetical protein
MFNGVSQCMPSVVVFYFGLFNPFEYSPLPLYLPPRFSTVSIHILISSTSIHLMVCDITDYHSLFLSLFPEFCRVVLITNMFYIWVCLWSCLFLYVYLWISLSHMRGNMCLLCFWSWLTSLNMMFSNCIHLPSNPCHYSLQLSNNPLCICTTISWSIHHL